MIGFSGIGEIPNVLKLADAFAKIKKLNQQKGVPMSKYLPLLITVGATLSSALAFPQYVSGHATAFAVLGAVAQVLHAVLPSVFGGTQ